MAIVNIESFLGALSDERRQKLEFIFKSPLQTSSGLFTPAGLIVSVDCVISENHSLTANITRNPVETGSTISDHIHIYPKSLTIEGVITEKPLHILPALAQVPIRAFLSSTARGLLGKYLGGYEKHLAIAGTGLIQQKIIAPILGLDRFETRKDVARLFWNNILKARFEAKQLFSIRSEVGLIENCFFKTLSWNRRLEHGGSLFFSANIDEIQTVISNVTILPLAKEAQKIINIGKRQPILLEGDGPADRPTEVSSRKITQIKNIAQTFKRKFSDNNVLSSTQIQSSERLNRRFQKIYKFNLSA